MPLFEIENNKLNVQEQTNFAKEKALQFIIERNLQTVFNCRFVASEFPTGAQHGGRIDTLALSEENNPVIIEYKMKESSELINQSLFYLAWIYDHRGDFEVAAKKVLGNEIETDWSDVRVICIAPNYRKYDILAVEVMGTNIELWTYRLFKDKLLFLEELQKKDSVGTPASAEGKDPVMVAAGKKAAITRATGSYTFAEHLEGKEDWIKELAFGAQEMITGVDASIEENPRKHYIAYRTTQNIVCVEVQTQKIYLFLKLDPKKHAGPDGISRDVSNVGHFGTGELEVTITSQDDLEETKPFVELAFRSVGG